MQRFDRGRGIPFSGNYSSWLDQKRTRLQQEEKTESARQKTLEREFEWVKMAPRARQAKSRWSRSKPRTELGALDQTAAAAQRSGRTHLRAAAAPSAKVISGYCVTPRRTRT